MVSRKIGLVTDEIDMLLLKTFICLWKDGGHKARVATLAVLVVNFFAFCDFFIVAICELVHN